MTASLTVSAVSLALLAGLATPARGADVAPAGLAELLPQETVFYFSANAHELVEGIANLDLVRLLQDEEMRDFLAPVFEQLPGISSVDPIGSIWSMAPIGEFVGGDLSIGISGIAMEYANEDGSMTTRRISPDHPLSAHLFHELMSYQQTTWTNGAVSSQGSAPIASLTLDFLASIEPGPALKKHVFQTLAQPPEYMECGEVIMSGRTIQAIRIGIPHSDGVHTTLYADLGGDRWLIGGDQTSFGQALSGGPAHSLAASPTYRAFLDGLTNGKGTLFTFLDLATALKVLRPLVPPIVMEELEINGLSSFMGLGFALSLVNGGVRESFMLGFDGASSGLFALFNALGGGFPALRDAPTSTAAFLGLRVDPSEALRQLKALTKRLAPRMLSGLEAQLESLDYAGFSLVDDVLPAFGSELAVCVSRPKNGPIPEAFLSLELRDEEKFNRLLEFARELATGEGVEIADLALKDSAPGYVVKIPEAVQPAFVVRQNRLIGAISALSLKNHLSRHVDSPSAQHLGQTSEVLQKVMSGLVAGQTDSLAMLAYLDLHSTIPALYETLAPMLQPILDESGLPLDASLLPMSETVQQYVSGLAVGITADQHGLGVHAFTPTGLLPAAVTALMLEQMDAMHRHGIHLQTGKPQGDSD